jgi:cell volume regulation protein A
VGLPNAHVYFDVGFVVVLVSLLVQGWSIAFAARRLEIAFPRSDPLPQRVELDLPGQLAQELVGYSVGTNSPYLRRGLLPSWAKPTLVVRDERVLTPEEAEKTRDGDYVYLLAPPEKAQALDRFFVDMPPPVRPDPRLLGDFFVAGDVTLAALAEIYGLQIAPEHAEKSLADYFAEERRRPIKQDDILLLGPIALLAHQVENGRVKTVGLRLAEPDEDDDALSYPQRLKRLARRTLTALRG